MCDMHSRRVTGMAAGMFTVRVDLSSFAKSLTKRDPCLLRQQCPVRSIPQLAKVSTDTDRDTDSQVYDLHVVYACINLENS